MKLPTELKFFLQILLISATITSVVFTTIHFLIK